MPFFTPSETRLWEKPIKEAPSQLTDAEINEKYRIGEERIVTETNREKIPNFVKALDNADYMQVRPFYQRRDRWEEVRQSKLIESFIMNIPVPPLFIYEKEFNKYEVMDGQQRITALKAFYNGEFKLKGLEIWKDLNGRTYSTLPSQVRQGLDRRSISYIVVLKESTQDEEEAVFLRQTVFQRLNTGGVALEAQEVRNCIFQGVFNDLLIELTQLDSFRAAFGLPKFSSDETEPNAEIKKFPMYQKLADAEMVLRFFALRHYEHYQKGMQGFLSIYMNRMSSATSKELSELKVIFEKTINTVYEVFKEHTFNGYSIEKDTWDKQPHKALFDCVMIGFAENIEHSSTLIRKRAEIVSGTKDLIVRNEPGTFTGRGNSKSDVKNRIESYKSFISSFV